MRSRKQLFQLCVFLIPIGFGIVGCNTVTAGDSAKAAPIISQDPKKATIPPTASPTSPPQMLSPTANPIKEPTPTAATPLTPDPEPTPIPGYIIYDVEQTFKISNEGPSTVDTLRLTVAKIQSLDPFQEVLYFEIDPPMEFISKSDELNNQFIEFELFNVQPDEEKQFKLKYEVVAHSQKTDTLECEGELITGFTEPEKYIESDAEGIIDLSQHLSKETTDVCQQVRTFYEFVTENVEYYPVHTPEDYGALKALEYKSGDCTEFSDLMIALSRSAGIPARFVEGIVSSPGEDKHDWVQVYLPGSGWTTMEPTWGRHEELREIYFAGTTPDHIILSTGRNLTALNNKHFWSSRFWWDKKLSQPVVKIKSDWEVTPKQ